MANPFTPEQISQILEEFFKVVGTRQYIGARYVPIFGRKGEESIEWDNSAPYEPLTIVYYQGNSYTSRQYVPVGVEITDQEFWAITGNYNAQVEAYRQEVRNILPFDETPTDGSTKGVTSTGIKRAVDAAVNVETTRAKEAEQVNATAIANETTRAKEAEQVNATAIANETTRAKEAEQVNATAIANEITRAKEAEQVNATAIANETTRAKEAEQVNATAIATNATAIATNASKIEDNESKLSAIYPFDTVPTNGSAKGVTSGSVYEALGIAGNVYAKPEDYGAVGDGTTDDTKAIQDAINANNCVCLGSGKRYLVASSINLKPHLTIIGANRDSTILLGSTAQIVLPSNSEANYELQLIGFTIRANGARTNTAIVLNDMVYSLLDNLCIRSDDGVDSRNGLLIQKADFTYPAFANVIRNCFFQRAAFYLKDSTDNVISGNKFWANDMNANAVRLQGNCNNNCFEGNHLITTNEYAGFDAEIEVDNLRFTNNYLDGCKNGMFVSLLATSSISGNHFYNNSIRPFAVNYMRGCSFTDNIFTDCCTSADSNAVGDVVLLYESYANVFKGNSHYRSTAPDHNTPAYVISDNSTFSSNIVCDTSLMYPYTYYTASKKARNCVYDNCYPQDMFNAD